MKIFLFLLFSMPATGLYLHTTVLHLYRSKFLKEIKENLILPFSLELNTKGGLTHAVPNDFLFEQFFFI